MESESRDTERSERYELGELFDDLSPESEMVFRTIGMVITLVLLGLAFAYPFIISR